MTIQDVAVKLRISPRELERESLRLFLRQRLRLVESELLRLASKYGVKSVVELDRLIQEGRLHEEETFEDYFEFDHLEAERDLLLDLLEQLD